MCSTLCCHRLQSLIWCRYLRGHTRPRRRRHQGWTRLEVHELGLVMPPLLEPNPAVIITEVARTLDATAAEGGPDLLGGA
jgi:hypothetical protein